MNNQQFRRLLQLSDDRSNGDASIPRSDATPSHSKRSALIPMTPRNVKGDVDFDRQMREHNAILQPRKKFKSATPKGVKYATGYTDRAKVRAEAGDAEDDKGGRIKALEEQMKLGQISQEMFESLRDEITGGDVGSTHLVKGLDRRLLERVRRGEDVLGTGESISGEDPVLDIEEELVKLEEKDVQAIQREAGQKKGTMAPPPPRVGMKRSRDDIMAELKAQRKAAAEAKAVPTLDTNKWRKVGDKRSKIEIDHKGREVLITVDESGVVKKKVRKTATQGDSEQATTMNMPDASKSILGWDAIIPEAKQNHVQLAEDYDDDDIFEGVGTEYNPLGDDESGDDDSEDEAGGSNMAKGIAKLPEMALTRNTEAQHSTAQTTAAATRSYFKDSISAADEAPIDRLAGVQEFLKKAAQLDAARTNDGGADSEDKEEKARLRKRAEMLGQRDRDMEDMDMGFGESRFGDAEDECEGKKTRLTEWEGSADDGWEEKNHEVEKKKRKLKKRKGDSKNMSDIMRVIEGRKSGVK